MSHDPYAYWRQALIDKLVNVPTTKPQCGFWRMRDGAPVAIWREGDEIHCLVDGEDSHAELAWKDCAARAITEEAYDDAADEDEVLAPSPPPDHNQPDLDNFLALQFELQAEIETAEELLKTPVKTQEDADRIGIWAKRLSDLENRAEARRVIEKEPHLNASREVDTRWKPITTKAEDFARRLKAHVQAWLLQVKAAERARAETEKIKAAEAWDKAQTIQDEGERSVVVAAAQAADEASAVRNATAGRTGMRVGLRSEKKARIVNYDAALQAVKDHPDIKEVVEKLAQRSVKGGNPIAGVEIITIERVV